MCVLRAEPGGARRCGKRLQAVGASAQPALRHPRHLSGLRRPRQDRAQGRDRARGRRHRLRNPCLVRAAVLRAGQSFPAAAQAAGPDLAHRHRRLPGRRGTRPSWRRSGRARWRRGDIPGPFWAADDAPLGDRGFAVAGLWRRAHAVAPDGHRQPRIVATPPGGGGGAWRPVRPARRCHPAASNRRTRDRKPAGAARTACGAPKPGR